MSWVITKVHDPEDTWRAPIVASNMVAFRVKDDDGNLYYEGYMHMCDGVSGFEPMDEFARGNVGATTVEILEKGRWVPL